MTANDPKQTLGGVGSQSWFGRYIPRDAQEAVSMAKRAVARSKELLQRLRK